MKKYLILSISLLMGVFASCTDSEEIEIITSHDVNFTIKTKKMYETFDLDAKIQEDFLRSKKYSIGVESFIYDSEGNLIDSHTTADYAYNDQHFSTQLNEGTYTILSVETLSDPSKNNEPIYWEYQGTNSLKTFSVKPNGYNYEYTSILGISSTTFNVGRSEEIMVSPNAIGSICHINYKYWDKSKYLNVGFGTYTKLTEYKADPSLDRDSRFIYENSDEGYFDCVAWLSVDKIHYVTNLVYMLENEISYAFCAQDEEIEGTNTWQMFVPNNKIKKLDDGKVYYVGFAYQVTDTPSIFGTYAEYNNWENRLTEPKTVLFNAPYIQWGASVSSVKSYMSQYNLISDIQQAADGTFMIEYEGKSLESSIVYFFTSETDDLIESDLYFETNKVSFEELNNTIASMGYGLINQIDNQSLFVSPDQNTYVFIIPYSSDKDYYVIAFADAEYLESLTQSTSKAYKQTDNNAGSAKSSHVDMFLQLLK